MISQLARDNLDDISDLIETLTQSFPPESIPPRPLLDLIKEAVEKGNAEVYVSKSNGKKASGFVSLGLVSNSISLLYSKCEDEKKELFRSAFEKLKEKRKPIRLGGPWITDNLSDYAISLGFRKFDRKFMIADRESIEANVQKELPEGYSIALYSDELEDPTADLMFRANENNVDVLVFPEFFGSLELCRRLIENTKNNRYGQWKDDISKVLRYNDRIIGICLLTLRGDYGYIPDIAIDPEFRRKGFGRILLLKSLKDLLETEEELKGISLDVTIENPARYLYESLGFKDVRNYSMYTWLENT
jgi:ribosomal protein S18 acetylase RimI-like enzyme